MFFDKLLNALKIENLYKNFDFKTTDIPDSSSTIHQAHKIEHYASSDSDYTHVLEILHYWSQHHYSKNVYKYYRNASFTEKKKYALIDILSCFSSGARDLNNFSPIFLSKLGITNTNTYLKELISKGYIIKANLIETLVASYNSKDLKTIAESIGIKKSGKKYDLAQRIANELSFQQAEQVLDNNRKYIISEKGKYQIVGNEDYLPLHKYLDFVSLAEFNDARIPEGGIHPRNFYDTMFQLLSNRKFFFECQGNFEDAGLMSLYLYNILIEELKKTTHNVPLNVILTNYVEYVYLYSCFCFHAHSSLEYGTFFKFYRECSLPTPDKHLAMLADQEPYLNYDALFFNKPPSFFTHDEFIEYIHEMLFSPMFNKQKWDYKIQNRVKEYDSFIRMNNYCSSKGE